MKTNKGFAPIAIVLIVLAALAVGGVAYYAGKSSNPAPQGAQDNNYQPPTNPDFPVVNASLITVLSPNGGETWVKGQKVKISWTSSKDIKFVDIRLNILGNIDNQKFSAPIASHISNSGSYDWTVKELNAEVLGVTALPDSNQYSLVVEDSEHNIVWDQSDKTFTITSSPTTTEVLKNQPAFLISAYSKNSKNYIDVDYVEWLHGDASIKAQVEDGQCANVSECYAFPNGYKRNKNPLVRTFEVDVNAPINIGGFLSCKKFNGCGQGGMVSFDEFKNLVVNAGTYGNIVNLPFKQPKTFITIDIRNNKVINIAEPYQE